MSTASRPQPRSEVTRGHLLDAALAEFAASGFEAASTRAIAARAGVHQPQINYHFASKDELWRAAVDHLFARLDATLAPAELLSGRERLERTIRLFVRFAADHPELNRIMMHEATSASERLDWLVDHHVRERFHTMASMFVTTAHADVDPLVLYYTFVGAASLLSANAPEGRRLTGREPTAATVVDAHANLLIAMMLTPPPGDLP
ncbi:unannotated protein [freshwater metagenome]|uniref:Unannotated protein n=1 Tax=freshwater metagenome TaxID=449393 RepID=A0A6J7EN25_9ZZZZ